MKEAAADTPETTVRIQDHRDPTVQDGQLSDELPERVLDEVAADGPRARRVQERHGFAKSHLISKQIQILDGGAAMIRSRGSSENNGNGKFQIPEPTICVPFDDWFRQITTDNCLVKLARVEMGV